MYKEFLFSYIRKYKLSLELVIATQINCSSSINLHEILSSKISENSVEAKNSSDFLKKNNSF